METRLTALTAKALKRPLGWIGKKLRVPPPEEISVARSAWDDAHCNDATLWAFETDRLRLEDSLALRAADPKAAFPDLLDLAEHGSVIAMQAVADAYYWGRGTATDRQKAESWARQAYDQGSLWGLLNLGSMLAWRGAHDEAEAVFQTGVDQDWAPAMYRLASIRLERSNSRQTLKEVRPLLERATALGSGWAAARLYRNMAWGHFGLGEMRKGYRKFWQLAKDEFIAHEEAKVDAKQASQGREVITPGLWVSRFEVANQRPI